MALLNVQKSPVAFTTFGMFIIDEIEWLPFSSGSTVPPKRGDLIGGAGTYAVLGARLCLADKQSKTQSISWIVDTGSDFPDTIRQTINQWNTDCEFRNDNSRLTTRAWNGYRLDSNDHRAFKYLTPKKRLEVASLSEKQLRSQSFHMVCSAARCIELTRSLRQTRSLVNEVTRAIVVWEPIPDLCTPEELEPVRTALQDVAVISTNAEELAALFSPADRQNRSQQEMVAKLMNWQYGSSQTVPVIREGAAGSTVYLYDGASVQSVHFPAYHNVELASKVVDPTGGGNTFLGALAIALTDAVGSSAIEALIVECLVSNTPLAQMPDSQISRIIVAMVYAVVAASFAIEQYGVPEVLYQNNQELWNNESFLDRVQLYLDREGNNIKARLLEVGEQTWRACDVYLC